MEKWYGKIAVVTGASAGIGATICQDLVEHGLIVIGLARRPKLIMELQYTIKNPRGKLYGFECDITSKLAVSKVFSQIEKDFGTIHILINNAGIVRNGLLLDRIKYEKCVNTNVIGPINCTTIAFEIMQKNKENCYIINMSSILGHTMPPTTAKPYANIYPATKHALNALTETLRQEINYIGSNKIKISLICPGLVKTDIAKAVAISQYQFMESKISHDDGFGLFTNNPCLSCKQVSDAVVFMLSTPDHVQIYDLVLKPWGEKA